MTYTELFPAEPVQKYVAGHGSIGEILRARGFTGTEDGDLSPEGILAKVSYNTAVAEGELTVRMADRIAIEMLGMHPSLIWTNWFDEDPDALDYGVIEDELLLGRFDTQKEFWQYVGDLANEEMNKNKRPRIVGNMMPEARDYLSSLPGDNYGSAGWARAGLSVGDRCKRDHLIESAGDLIARGATGMGCRACCTRPKLTVGSECRSGHKIETEADLMIANAGARVYCRECRRLKSAEGRAKAEAARKLTEQDVIDIKARLAAGEKQKALALEYGVSQPMISKVKRGINHKTEGKAA